MNDSTPRSSELGPSLSAGWKRVISAILVIHLAAVIYAPLTLDRAFEDLLRPLRLLRSYATALYLDHGYRFFAPDPGPTHTLRYELPGEDGEAASHRLPDRRSTRPRLLYHRWFMLGESLANEVANTLASYADYYENQAQLATDISERQQSGRMREALQLTTIHRNNEREFARRWEMTLVLSHAIKRHLEAKHPGQSIRLFSRRQLIPRPYDVLSGKTALHPDFVQEIELTNPQAVLDAAQPEEVSPPGDPPS